MLFARALLLAILLEREIASVGGEAERVSGMRVTPGFFRVTGIEPALGRGLTDAENRWDNRRFVILSADLWRRRFNADPDIVGRSVQLGGQPHVVKKSEIKSRKLLEQSLMPPGLTLTLKLEDVADLLAFLEVQRGQ